MLLISLIIACFGIDFALPVADKADDVIWFAQGGQAVSYTVQTKHDAVVDKALQLFASDMQAVTGEKVERKSKGQIEIMQLDKATTAQMKRLQKRGIDTDRLLRNTDAFVLKVLDGKIIVAGGNGRGVAYGILELSRKAGVSPWVWWGDCVPERKTLLTLPADYECYQSASVEMRGIFLNDEDWSFRKWGATLADNNGKEYYRISLRAYRRVFELLLRLRANALWPAMHPGTEAFFKNAENKLLADSFGIFVGSSHCEPLLRNNVDEWDVKKRGAFNYMTNREEVHRYWTERLQEVKHSNTNIFTIGMRGIHDGSMEGVKTAQEKFDALQQVIDDQQELIRQNIGSPERQMQVFVPYKEVLELYEKGLRVPEYVTLMWCDDNYGYLTRLSDAEEQKRQGGGGVYYHLSYWGRPHDYLWLTTTQPGLIYNELKAAYNHNVRKLWIANVHDPKVAGYDLELFLDMAWNIDSVDGELLDEHYKAWLCRQFGSRAGERLLPAMCQFYRLTAERKPEFMGWNQNELDKKVYPRGLSPVQDTEFSFTEFGSEADRYLKDYEAIATIVEQVGVTDIRQELQTAYFAAIKYPVWCAYLMAVKMLEAQRARATHSSWAAVKSKAAHKAIQELTSVYNTMADGKWNNLMDMQPRKQLVFEPPTLPDSFEDSVAITPLMQQSDVQVFARNASTYDSFSGNSMPAPVSLLGHSLSAVPLPKGQSLTYCFHVEREGYARLKTALIPTQPNDGGNLRYSVAIDGGEEIVYSLKEPFRSERWKLNVLRGQALRSSQVWLAEGNHTLTIKALDHHIVLDQWMIDFNLSRKHYLFPVE